MLSTLATLKSRLAIPDIEPRYDEILTDALTAVSVRFDRETGRLLARAAGTTYEFPAEDTEILPSCYPIESVSKFELKTTEAEGWVEQTGVNYVVRGGCVISLVPPAGIQPVVFGGGVARITYTGGYVLPGDTPGAGQTALPADLESAAVEQAAAWFIHRDNVGLEINWPKGGVYQRFSQLPLLPQVSVTLRRYQRWNV